MIKLKDANDSVSSIKEDTDSLWSNLAIETDKISPLDTPNQPTIKSKGLDGEIINMRLSCCFYYYWTEYRLSFSAETLPP